MESLRFTLSGKTAFFKKPDVNTYLYFTYGNIHKVALLGIIGAILGFKGYNLQDDREYPEFYEKLKEIKVAIIPKNAQGYISKKVQTFNNSVGYASKEEGGNLIIKEQWLEEPSWQVFILLEDSKLSEEITDRFLTGRYKYIPYLGKNDHFASITDVEVVEMEVATKVSKIDSLFPKENVELLMDDFGFEDDEQWKYEENLPVGIEEHQNQYLFKKMCFTNMKLRIKEQKNIYSVQDKTIHFI